MNKILLLLTLTLSLTAFSQIGETKEIEKYTLIGKTTNPYKWITLEYRDEETASGEIKRRHKLSFKNLEYPNINDSATLFFWATPEELDYLFNTFMEMCNVGKDVTKVLDLGEATLSLKGLYKSFDLRVKQDGEPIKHTWLNKGQVKKVFKRKK